MHPGNKCSSFLKYNYAITAVKKRKKGVDALFPQPVPYDDIAVEVLK